MSALQAIRQYKAGDLGILRRERWLLHLALTKEHQVNLERLESLEERKHNYVLEYVYRSLAILESLPAEQVIRRVVEDALKWSEVAKAGLPCARDRWIRSGCNLAVHNEGSAQIYLQETTEQDAAIRRIVHDLIATHGLIGQYLRAEVLLDESRALRDLVTEGLLSEAQLSQALRLLNRCIIGAVNESLWQQGD